MIEGHGKESAEPVTINLGNINEGAAVAAFELEIGRVLANIIDMSTVATATRSIVLKVDFKPESDRLKVHTEFSVTTKLASIEKHKSKIFIAKTEDGGLVALDSNPHQMPLWETPKRAEPAVIQFQSGGQK